MLSNSQRRHVVRSLLLLAAAAGVCVTGCAATKSKARTSAQPQRTSEVGASRFPVVHEDWANLGYRLDWVGFPFPNATLKSRVVAMSVFADCVAVQEGGSTITLMESTTGQNRWSDELTGPLTKWVGIVREPGDAGRLLVCSESELFMLSLGTGNLVGREPFARVVNTAPMLVGTHAINGTSTGVVQAHMIGRGLPAWAFSSKGSIDQPLLEVGGFIAAVSQGGDVLFLTGSGNLVGRARIFGGLDAPPATDGQNLFIAGRDQSVWAFDSAGATLWRYRTPNPLNQAPVFHNGTLYVDLGQEGLSAFDPATGTVKWSNKDVHGSIVAVRSGRLLVRDAAGMSVVDPARGDRMERVELPGVTRITTDKFEDGNVYCVSDEAVVAKFMPR
ncbi:hypothetical protein PHYC_01578 [Phycisphaerales bacterium]|nr:hypothetical protein PHYC_01578 [Phycisphaerales bacterium]